MRLLLFNLAMDADDPVLGFAIRWIEVLAQHVTSIDIITMRSGRFELPGNVRVYSVGKEKGYSKPRRGIEFYRILWKLLNTKRYEGCFAHMMPLFALMAAPLLRLKRIPIVLWYTHKSVTPILHLATLVVDRIVTASQESFRIPSKKVRIIGHGIDTDRFVPGDTPSSPSCPFTILTVGRLSPIKRVDLLIEAIGILHQKNPEFPVCLKLVGGPLTEKDHGYVTQLKKQVAQHQLQDVVSFVGNVPFREVVACYQQADCFVSMSNTGAIDKAVLEAMSCGLTVIVNQAFADVLGEELAKTWVVDWDDEPLCDRLLHLMSLSASERQSLGEKLRAIVVRDHTLKNLCQRVLAELEAVHKDTPKA
jgi:glycosyltransferase involved in cell wall biosynthesis